MENSRKYLCVACYDSNEQIIPQLSRCPANPEMVMAAIQFLGNGMTIEISVEDKEIDFFNNETKSE